MRVPLIITLSLLAVNQWTYSQIAGCMDPAAPNYNPSATNSNGSCNYAASQSFLISKCVRTATLKEISGMTLIAGKLYAHNDGGNANAIYQLDTTTRAIIKTITLAGTTNLDWEDITNDGTYIYVGDFGNNANGARTNLKFYRVPIASINTINGASGTVAAGDIDVINFTYEDQPQPPTAVSGNSTAFDCEAVVYDNGYLYLFTKNWSNLLNCSTSQYRIPAMPGSHVAVKLGSFNTGGSIIGDGVLITSAVKSNDGVLLLLGHGRTDCAVWAISGFTDMDHLFQTGNKRRIKIGSYDTHGQTEAIAASSQTWALVANELGNGISQRLHSLNLQPFIPQYVLPLGIASFTARRNDNTAYLNWEYDAPDDVKEFVIEAATDANGNYSVIGKVTASASRNSYDFVHYNLEADGILYYRVKTVSLDGTIQYSKILTLKTGDSGLFKLTSMPSPFDNKIDISFYSDTPQLMQLTVVDLLGRKLKSQKLQAAKGQHTLSMDGLFNLTSGIYFLQARTSSQTFVRKIMKR